MKYAEIKDLSRKDLQVKVNELRRKLFEESMKNSIGQVTNPLSIRHMRRDVARMKTALRHQELKSEVKS